MMESARQSVIAEMHRAGHSAKATVDAMGYAKRTVYRLVRKLKDGEDVQRRQHKPRSDRKRTSHLVDRLKRAIDMKPTTTMTKLAKNRKVSRRIDGRVAKDDLGTKSM